MSRAPVRLRYVNRIVGSFLLLVFLLMVGFAVLVASRENWWRTFELRAAIPATELSGLQRGTPVYFLGEQIGEVSRLAYARDGDKVNLVLTIQQRFQGEILPDSIIRMKRRLSGAGESYLEIIRNPGEVRSASQRTAEGMPAVFQVRVEDSATDGLMDEVRRIRSDLDRITENFTENFTDMKKSVARIEDHVQEARTDWENSSAKFRNSLDHLNTEMSAIRKSSTESFDQAKSAATQAESTFRELQDTSDVIEQRTDATAVKFGDVADQMQSVLTDMKQVSPRLDPLMNQFEQIADDTRAITGAVRTETRDLPGTVRQTRDVLSGAQGIIDDLEASPLLRSHWRPPPKSRVLPPVEIQGGR